MSPVEDTPAARGYSWYVVAVLILAYTLSYVDRSILTLMVAPIRASLAISDVQLSLLHGLAFAVFYTFLGMPIGRLVDTRRRTTIVACGIGLWSVMTGLCGFARSFGTMFAARIGVGVGEAALSPAAYSMLADRFAGKRLVRALSVYQSAIYVGPGIATVIAGMLLQRLHPIDSVIGHFEPWQQVFVLIGLPGVLVAMLVATLREPRRRGAGANEPLPSLALVMRHLKSQRGAYGLLILGFACQSIAWNGAAAWIPTNFIRHYGWTPADVAIGYGPAIAFGGTSGILFGGWLAGALRDRGWRDANIRVGIIAAAGALPFGIAAPLMPTGAWSLTLVCGFLFCGAMPYGGAAAALQDITPNRMRGQVSAIYLFWLNLAGIGCGPTIVALTGAHVYGGDDGIGRAISTVIAIASSLAVMILVCNLAPYRKALDQAAIAP